MFLLIVALSNTVYSQKKNGQILEKAYKRQSQELLGVFFQNWNDEIQPFSNEVISSLDDTVQNMYQVFEEFYSPRNLKRIGGSEFGEIYQNTRFIVVQNHLRGYITNQIYYTDAEIDSIVMKNIVRTKNLPLSDTLSIQKWTRRFKKDRENMILFYGPKGFLGENSSDSLISEINDFRPNGLPDDTVLFLSKKYVLILEGFLGEINNNDFSERYKKQLFIEEQINISQGLFDWWHLVTYPSVRKVTFDKNFEYAEVQYRILHEGGEAILKKIDGEWKLISAERTWIE